jgi:microcystin-dependent protein
MDEYIGIVKLFAGNFAPRGWAFCWGQLLPISQYSALFSILGTYYGGNGTTSFALPDLRGRAAIGVGAGIGISPVVIGQFGGVENITLNTQNLPAHNHAVTGTVQLQVSRDPANSGTPAGAYLAGTSPNNTYNTAGAAGNLAGVSQNLNTALTGQTLPFASRNPYLGMNYIICLVGLFPSPGLAEDAPVEVQA